MAAFTKVYAFVDELGKGSHNFSTAVLKFAVSNTAPTTASTIWSLGNFPAPTTNTGGYAPVTLTTTSWSQTSGVAKLVIADGTITSTGGSVGPFQYVILYNSSSGDKIVGWYDYGSAVTLATTETFTVDFDPSLGALTIT
jgi:hypothetical protein